MNDMSEIKFPRLPKVIDTTGRSRSTILRGAKDGSFPAQVHIAPRAIAWVSTEVAACQQKCLADSKGKS